jgi:S-formylglutathione hydrolase FrmB
MLAVVLWDVTATAGCTAMANAAGNMESLMVPSAAMGRDIPVAFMSGGPHAVYLLDAFNAAPDVSNWVTAGNAMNTLAGKGISVVAPPAAAQHAPTGNKTAASSGIHSCRANSRTGWRPTED